MGERYPYHKHYTFQANQANWNKSRVSLFILENLTEEYIKNNKFIPSFINRKTPKGKYDFIQLRRSFGRKREEVWVEVAVYDNGLTACMCSKEPIPEKASKIAADSILNSIWESRITQAPEKAKNLDRLAS